MNIHLTKHFPVIPVLGSQRSFPRRTQHAALARNRARNHLLLAHTRRHSEESSLAQTHALLSQELNQQIYP